MGKDPAFLFYPNDWIGGTMGMTLEEKGAYIELLMMQFNRGHMTKHMIGLVVGQLWDKVEDKFEVDDKGLYYNVRLDEEKEKRKKFTESRRNNVLGKNQYSKPIKEVGHMTKHMENENEDVNINGNEYRKFKHLSISEIEFNKLNKTYSSESINDILDKIENYKNNKKYNSLYLTALNWLKKENKSAKTKDPFLQ